MMNTNKRKSVNGSFNDILSRLAKGERLPRAVWMEAAAAMCAGINDRFGSSTFSFQTALRVLLTAGEKHGSGAADAQDWQMPDACKEIIKPAFTGYRFFMTTPGCDDMVLWSENLQIQLASAEYFTALLWEDAVFSADGKPAAQHRQHAEQRIRIWLNQRWLYGFSEWNSPTYYTEDISPLCLIIDFSPDGRLREQAKIILDLLFYDLASKQFKGIFGASAGRVYANGRRLSAVEDYDGRDPLPVYNSVGAAIEEMAGPGVYAGLPGANASFVPGPPNGMLGNFRYRKPGGYDIPEVFKKIAADKQRREYRESQGLTLTELVEKGLVGPDDAQIMMQWAMESFSNPETVENTVTYCRKHGLFNNANFRPLKHLNLSILRLPGLLPALTGLINPHSNGLALQRANVYTYKTPHCLQSTAQRYCPGTYGNQQHLWTVSFGAFAVFASNPREPAGGRMRWVGDGVTPAVAQDKNITLCIYRTKIAGLKTRRVYRHSHAHFPASLFDRTDESRLSEGMVFGEINGGYVALLAGGPLFFEKTGGGKDSSFSRNDLVQNGKTTWWICETGDEGSEGFDSFIGRVSGNKRSYDRGVLRYESRGSVFKLVYGDCFYINETLVTTEYGRYESDFIKAGRESETMAFRYGGSSLFLDFGNAVRIIENDSKS